MLGYGIGALSRRIFLLALSLDQIVLAKAMDQAGEGIRSAPRDAITAASDPGAGFGRHKSLDTVGGFADPLVAVWAITLMAGDIPSVAWFAAIPTLLRIILLIFFARKPTGIGNA